MCAFVWRKCEMMRIIKSFLFHSLLDDLNIILPYYHIIYYLITILPYYIILPPRIRLNHRREKTWSHAECYFPKRVKAFTTFSFQIDLLNFATSIILAKNFHKNLYVCVVKHMQSIHSPPVHVTSEAAATGLYVRPSQVSVLLITGVPPMAF